MCNACQDQDKTYPKKDLVQVCNSRHNVHFPTVYSNPAITLTNGKPRLVREKNAIPLLSKQVLVYTCPINTIYMVMLQHIQYMNDMHLAHPNASNCAQFGQI